MLAFIDESGDTGRKIDNGSSRYFIVSLIIFENNNVAIKCDNSINQLRKELKLNQNFEFHFSTNSHNIRIKFLNIIKQYDFIYFSVVINKSLDKLWGEGFNSKESFYKYTCHMVFNNAIKYLKDAIIILDRSGTPDFRNRLSSYIKRKINTEKNNYIKKIKQQKSNSNNLLQLADYISGIINRKVQNKSDWQCYYEFIKAKERNIQIWPK
ncbi:MAG: DUF3800 domain-containing protein [Elusimicrobia bacterium]|nr:DUF3800 domain-containing protein [Elusimicrobiota bacterium]